MYRNKTPDIHEIVFVQLSHNTLGENYVNLVEYDNLEGLVLCTEITRWKSNLKSLVKRDDIFPVVVIGNKDGGIDLSYSKIKDQHRKFLQECYEYQTKLYNLIDDISTELKVPDNFKDIIITNNFNPEVYVECITENTNIPKLNYESILENPTKIFDKIKSQSLDTDQINNFCNLISSKIIMKPYHTERYFTLSVCDNNSLTKLKQILHDIKNIKLDNHFDFDLSCKSSPVYQIKINDIDMDKIKEKYDILINQINNIIDDYKKENNIYFDFIDDINIIKQKEIYYH